MTKIVFANLAQLTLWTTEVRGQISDGWWENVSPHGHWRDWSEAEPKVADAQDPFPGVDFYPRKSNYDLTVLASRAACRKSAEGSDWLYDLLTARMIKAVREATGVTMTATQIRAELNAMKWIMRHHI